jgi:hypothetical protein
VPNSFNLIPLNVQLKQVLQSLIEVNQVQGLFAPSAFTLIFPLLKAIIFKEGRVPLLKDKLYTECIMSVSDLLIGHSGLEDALEYLPRKSMVECLLNLIETFPLLRVAAKGGLLALALATSHLEVELAEGEIESDLESDSVSNLIRDISGVLLNGLLNIEPVVRESCIGAFFHLPLVSSSKSDFDVRLWVLCSDTIEENASEANNLWNDVHGDEPLSVGLLEEVSKVVCHKCVEIRVAAGISLCKALSHAHEFVTETCNRLYNYYEENAAEPVPEYDAYGLVISSSLNKPDQWQARSGIALAIESLVPVIISKEDCIQVFQFLIEKEALGDRNDVVREQMLNAGLAIINAESGRKHIKDILDLLDKYLSKPSIASETHDAIRQSVVILMGTLAHHLESTDQRVGETIDKLIDTLTTPSESVQIAVSQCLPPLVKSNKGRVDSLVKKLLDMLFNSENYGHRRGAAYGIAGIVKGVGVSSLKDYLIMAHLKDAVEAK